MVKQRRLEVEQQQNLPRYSSVLQVSGCYEVLLLDFPEWSLVDRGGTTAPPMMMIYIDPSQNVIH